MLKLREVNNLYKVRKLENNRSVIQVSDPQTLAGLMASAQSGLSPIYLAMNAFNEFCNLCVPWGLVEGGRASILLFLLIGDLFQARVLQPVSTYLELSCIEHKLMKLRFPFDFHRNLLTQQIFECPHVLGIMN